MSNALKAREPSMEEILASIRKIIESGDERTTSRNDRGPTLSSVSVNADEWTRRGAAESDDVSDLHWPGGKTAAARSMVGDNDPRDAATADNAAWPEGPGTPANDGLRSPAVTEEMSSAAEGAATARSFDNQAVLSDHPDMRDDERLQGGSLPETNPEAFASFDDAEPQIVEAGGAETARTGEGEDPITQAHRQAITLVEGAKRRRDEAEDFKGHATTAPATVETPGALATTVDPAEDGPAVVDTVGMQHADLAEAGTVGSPRTNTIRPSGEVTDRLDDSWAGLEAGPPIAESEATTSVDIGTSVPSITTDAIDFFADFDEDEFAAEILGHAETVPDAGVDDRMLEAPTGGEDAIPASAEPGLSGQPEIGFEQPSAVTPSANDIYALISRETGGRITESFDELSRAVREEQLRNLDGTVREMLRPMLHEWLDDNLPRLVERLVREEIERVARGPRV